MSVSTPATETVEDALRREAARIGFDLIGIAPAARPAGFESLVTWLNAGHAGEMSYLDRRRAAYEHPRAVLSTVRSVVAVALNYHNLPPSADIEDSQGRVSRYAWGDRDYHAVLRERLDQLADVLHAAAPGCRTRCVVDTAPLLERDFARLAGLGWFGKNTMLINRRIGSWFFLGALLTDLELTPDAPHETAHCGTCTRCLEACPTDAFVEPYVLDARKCISYLTIELRDQPVPAALREGMGEWLFGCDVCQDVCPWNRKPPLSDEPAFRPRADLRPADCAELLSLDEEQFQDRFAGTPLLRPGRSALLRNACLVLGNAGDPGSVPALSRALTDHDPLVRGAAAWALGRIGGMHSARALESRAEVEDNPTVIREIRLAGRVDGAGRGAAKETPDQPRMTVLD